METINKNEVKKELLRSKVNATFSHYTGGTMYYTVQLAEGLYQFPINTVETCTANELPLANQNAIAGDLFQDTDNGTVAVGSKFLFKEKLYAKIGQTDGVEEDFEEAKFKKLSSDLGSTTFGKEERASMLNRYIDKAIEKGEFVKID